VTKNVEPLAIEPFDKEWGGGISGLTENPAPFPRINRMLKWLKELDTSADAQRALIVTQCYENNAMYPQNIKCAMAMRDVFSKVDVRIWPEELIVGELAAPPNSAPIYPEFSYDWLATKLSTTRWTCARTTVYHRREDQRGHPQHPAIWKNKRSERS
jgi:formate C-acetyltransferase